MSREHYTQIARIADLVILKALPEDSELEGILNSVRSSDLAGSLEEVMKTNKRCYSFEPIRLGYGAVKKHSLQRSSQLQDFRGNFPWFLGITSSPNTYETCAKCKGRTPLFLLEKTHDAWRDSHLIGFILHCSHLEIIYNHLYETPFP